jgi:hypothetical protein
VRKTKLPKPRFAWRKAASSISSDSEFLSMKEAPIAKAFSLTFGSLDCTRTGRSGNSRLAN